MIEYVDIYLKKQGAEYSRILTVYDAKLLYKVLSSYRDRYVSERCQKFKRESFAKRIIPECRCTIRNFSGQLYWAFVEQGYFDKHFKNMWKTQKKEPHREKF